jgi:penicillin amidase
VGTYGWRGFRDDLPTELNPQRGWIATANHDIHPPGYDPPLFFKNGSSFPRFQRIAEVLGEGGPFSLEDARVLQQDAFSPRALAMLEAFRGWTAADPDTELARQDLANWDGVFGKDSRAALLYDRFQRTLSDQMGVAPVSDPRFRRIAEAALAQTVESLRDEFGEDRQEWRWGRLHRSEFPHSLVSAYDIPGVERSGGAGTVAATGATYRHIIDFSDLDGSLGSNAPGQSGRPGSPYYGNLTASWGAGEYFPLLFSREAVEAQAQHRLILRPRSQ